MCVCVRFGVSFTYLIESIDSKFIFVCLINDYSLIADLLIFVYGSAECATISLECSKMNFLILNNFVLDREKKKEGESNGDKKMLRSVSSMSGGLKKQGQKLSI